MTAANGRKPVSQPLVFTIPETADLLRVHRDTVYEYIRDGDLKAIDIARPGAKTTKLRVPADALNAFIASRPSVHSP
ncbi:helix-turn-helix domain-containing protein [Nonomuraea sp. MTCD27]|uniref:helix-turn-helix domain-containing protein n=1 Tax=Nonomuraea sp. MTCD27 TaxID=1676747 RepID=UPI0035C04DDB